MTVRTRAQLNSDADTNLADNTAGDISASDVRASVKDLADSAWLAEHTLTPLGLIYGLTLSNNGADATNDIDIAVGSAASDDTVPVPMTLSSALTKRLDAAWAVGSGNGGLDTGSIANTTYHIWLIRRPDTGVVDALFSTSASAPTMPANYTQKRRIGSIMRVSAAIRLFYQTGDSFYYNNIATARSSTSDHAYGLLTLPVPIGINVSPMLAARLVVNTVTDFANMLVSDYRDTGFGNFQLFIGAVYAGQRAENAFFNPGVTTNTSGQIYFRQEDGSGTLTEGTLLCSGYVDTRGRI